MAPSTLRTCSIVAATLLAVTAILAAANAALAQQSSPLPAPELTAQPADRAVNLTWTEVAGAARYELWSWRNQETGWQQIGGDNLTGASYTHSNLIAGATYHYQIRAVSADDENGDWSARVSAATPPALDAPELTAQAAAGAVQLNWTEVDTAVRYLLWSWWNEETGWQQLGGDNLTATGYTHTDLTVGTTYYYQMRALNAAGESSAWSQRVSATVTEAQQRQRQRQPRYRYRYRLRQRLPRRRHQHQPCQPRQHRLRDPSIDLSWAHAYVDARHRRQPIRQTADPRPCKQQPRLQRRLHPRQRHRRRQP